MRTITLEEHYATPAFMEGPGRQLKDQARALQAHPQVAAALTQLLDRLGNLDDHRIADMDAAGIDVQVLSLTSPGTEQLEAAEAVALAREANDLLAEAVRRHPSRFAGFAALPTAAPDTAADELERTIRTHGFKGALINGHIRGRYLDDPFFWPILERAEALQVPLYLHPTPPPQPVIAGLLHGTLRARGDYRPLDRSLGLAHRNGDPCPATHPQWSIRPLPRLAADHRPPGRNASVHAAQTRSRVAHAGDETGSSHRSLSAREPPLHVQWLQLPPRLPRHVVSSRGRPDHVLSRLSLQFDGAGTHLPGATADQPCRQRSDRTR